MNLGSEEGLGSSCLQGRGAPLLPEFKGLGNLGNLGNLGFRV